ncbi:hypothetical protein [Plantibacter sp. YIM 135249]|uniref:hypothetical protein n=1 Tax=Plantibacter sp. YIM 135249 TaxID=3423918 RepID=UPI003D33BD3F
MKPLLPILIAAFLLTGCAGGQAESASTPSPTPTPTTKIPAVSLETSCTFLYGRNVDGPLSTTADIIGRFVEAPDGTTITTDELRSTIDSIQSARDRAQPEIQPFIDAQIAPLAQLLDAKTGGGNGTINFEDYKASGIELLNQCKPYLLG